MSRFDFLLHSGDIKLSCFINNFVKVAADKKGNFQLTYKDVSKLMEHKFSGDNAR